MLARLLVAAALALSALAVGCGDQPAKEECEKLLAHVIELSDAIPQSQRLSPRRKQARAKQHAAVKRQLESDFVERCQEEMKGDVVRCQLKTRTEAALAECEE